MIPSADFGDSNGRVYKLFKMKETLGRSGSWWKTGSFLFCWVVAFTIFQKTDQRLSQLPPSGAGISWDVNKRSPRLAGFAQFLFKLWRTAQLGFLARRFCRGGWNSKGGKFRNFESINQMSKVDTEGGKSFCSSLKLFQDRTSWYKCRICIGSSALTSFLIIIIAQWDIMWSKWGEKFKGGKGFLYLLKKGERGRKNVGIQRVEIFSEVNSVRGKYCTLFENERGFLL